MNLTTSIYQENQVENLLCILPFGHCPCLAKLGWSWLCSLLIAFAGRAADMPKKQSGPVLYWKRESGVGKTEASAGQTQSRSQ